MNSPKTPIPSDDLAAQLQRLGLALTAQHLNDLVARATSARWSPRQLLEEVARNETQDQARRGTGVKHAAPFDSALRHLAHHTGQEGT